MENMLPEPPPSDATATDQWLVESCRKITGCILTEIVNPWSETVSKAEANYKSAMAYGEANDKSAMRAMETSNKSAMETVEANYKSAMETAEANYKSVTEEIAATEQRILGKFHDEVRADFMRLGEVKTHFSGIILEAPGAAVAQRLEQINASPPPLVRDDVFEECRSTAHVAFQTAKSAKAVLKDRSGLFFEELGTWLVWVLIGTGVLIGTTASGFSLLLGLVATIAIPAFFAHQTISAAERQWFALVNAIALKNYWANQLALKARQAAKRQKESAELTAKEQKNAAEQRGKEQKEFAKRGAKERKESVEQAAKEHKTAVERALTLTLSTLVKDKEGLTRDLKATIDKIYATGLYKAASTSDRSAWASWAPAVSHAGVVRIGELSISVRTLPSGYQHLAQQTQIARGITLPILASLKNGKSIYVRINDHTKAQRGCRVAQNMIFRILASAPPAKVLFTFIDPIGQGQNAASFLSLADYDESLVNSKVWTDPRQIERKLTDLTEHMETVIQKYLRTDYLTIEDYNKAAGEIAEAYRVVVIFDFPDSISENAARQLERIVQNGGRCGVYAIIVHDTSKKPSYGVNEENIVKHSLAFNEHDGTFSWDNYGYGRFDNAVSLSLDEAPPEELVKRVIKTVGEKSKDALKVEVPYTKLLQLAGIDGSSVWTESTAGGIRVPLGPGNARKPRFLDLGVGLSVHALVVGRPGSGKSNLMHVVITTAARLYSPDELHLYLIDFKEGVEFKPYAEASLPHARVIAIRSEREFGLSVLRSLDNILKQRGEMFRKLGVPDIGTYRELTGENGEKRKLPRILLLVDEFQEFFVKQDGISDEVAILFDRIVRQGRAFGMHLLLGSQTLAGYSLPKATLNLITVRIALQSGEADSRMILADDNTAARLLSRPGEGIYNASSGLVEGNNLFQVALFEDEDRQDAMHLVDTRLRELRAKGAFPADQLPPPIVFEGHEPAILEKCPPLTALLTASSWPEGKRAFEVWLGEPIAIKPPTAMKLSQRGGSHLLVVTKNEEEAVGVLTAAVVSLVARVSPGTSEISILNLTTADAAWADVPEQMAELFGAHKIRVLGRRDLQGVLEQLSTLVKDRSEGGRKVDSSHYLVLLGMHRARDLRQEGYSGGLSLDEDSKPNLASQFATILRDGPESGVHLMAWCDSYANLDRTVDHRLLAEFGTRVVGQMSTSDSSRLIDDDAAAQIDRPHRLIKYDEEHVGVLEMFRPYALPSRTWLENVGATLCKRIC